MAVIWRPSEILPGKVRVSQVLTSVAANAVCFVLLIACAEHLRTPRALPAALAAHKTVPGRFVRPLSLAVTTLEGLLGVVIGLLILTEGSARVLTATLAAAAALFTVYTAYTWRLVGRAVPCGCSRTDALISGWVVVRAAALAVLAAGAAIGAQSVVAPPESAARFAEVAIAGAAFAVLLWVLPEAMLDPTRNSSRDPALDRTRPTTT
jgi:methylamine utilization protein MauE